MDLWHLLERACGSWPATIAVVDGAERRTYTQLAARAEALSSWLASQGVVQGERVALLAENRGETLEAYYACARLGAILCPLNTRLAPRELAEIVGDAAPAVWLVEDELSSALDEARRSQAPRAELVFGEAYESALAAAGPAPERVLIDEDAVAQLYYTSGTTGRSKGVMLTHRNVVHHALCAASELQLTDADHWAHVAPLFHLADAWATFAITWVGGQHVVCRRFESRAVLDLLEREQVTLTNLVPTMIVHLLEVLDAEPDRSADLFLRLLLSGGAPIAPSTVRRISGAFGCEYLQTYGLTETSPYLTLSRPLARHADLDEQAQLVIRAKTGRPFLGVQVLVTDDEGAPVPCDDETVGEVRARGPSVTPGYWRRPDATASAFEDDAAGGPPWLLTGDLATVDSDGYLTIRDRKKDVILTGGETVYSTEVENVLAEHEGVLEVAVWGEPDEVWGERIVASIVPARGRDGALTRLEEPALLGFCRDRLANYKCPRRVELLDELPRTGSGKIRKETLRKRR